MLDMLMKMQEKIEAVLNEQDAEKEVFATLYERQILKISPLAIFYRCPPLVVQNTRTASHQLAILCGAACILKHVPVSLYTTTKPRCFSTPSKPRCLQTGPLLFANRASDCCLQTVCKQ